MSTPIFPAVGADGKIRENHLPTRLSESALTEKIESTAGSSVTPHIGDNGNWWVGDEDTGVPAEGQDGAPGIGNGVLVEDPPGSGFYVVEEGTGGGGGAGVYKSGVRLLTNADFSTGWAEQTYAPHTVQLWRTDDTVFLSGHVRFVGDPATDNTIMVLPIGLRPLATGAILGLTSTIGQGVARVEVSNTTGRLVAVGSLTANTSYLLRGFFPTSTTTLPTTLPGVGL